MGGKGQHAHLLRQSVCVRAGTSHKQMLGGSASGRGRDKHGGVLRNAKGGHHTTLLHLGTALHLQLVGTQNGWRSCWIVSIGKVKEWSWGQVWQDKHPMPKIAGCGASAPAQSKERPHFMVEAYTSQ